VTIAIALTLLVSGVVLIVFALAFWLGTILDATWMGFAVVGGATMAIGGGVTTWAVRSLSTRNDLRFPETRGQLGRDIEWLDRQLGNDKQPNSSD